MTFHVRFEIDFISLSNFRQKKLYSPAHEMPEKTQNTQNFTLQHSIIFKLESFTFHLFI